MLVVKGQLFVCDDFKGHVEPGKQDGSIKSELDNYQTHLAQIAKNIQTQRCQDTASIGVTLTING
ncbi:MAG: hypothetical protein KME32_21775 [Mojavia pulchra JT2-VF2]|uniref:Uncharacterized protein n=1 Tax=Mojavia pulchra JT2-VF2 TaxID=287848 RepID=A0A951Q1M7_9NOST|nr:hypothetical protein [Mojavia pulchra JT2-VF2]